MIKPEQIPKTVLNAAAKALYEQELYRYLDENHEIIEWRRLSNERRQEVKNNALASIAAAINSWPSAYEFFSGVRSTQVVGLPLPEKGEG